MAITAIANRTQIFLRLSPHGTLLAGEGLAPRLVDAFARSEAEGWLGLASMDGNQPPAIAYWREIASEFLRLLCLVPEGESLSLDHLPDPDLSQLTLWMLNAPPMPGAEYLRLDVLGDLWDRLRTWTLARVGELDGLARFLEKYASRWSRIGRVSLHLAESKNDPDFPFAFMASYASGLNPSGKVRRLPLGRALKEYAGAGKQAELIKLLEPLQKAQKSSALIADLINSGDIFHPLAWTPEEAYDFLQEIPLYEAAGLLVQLPNWWRKRARPQVGVTIGAGAKSAVGASALLDFKVSLVLNGETLTRQEIDELLQSGSGLILLRGEWVSVDQEKLREALSHWKQIEEVVADGGISFYKGMRLLAGAPEEIGDEEIDLDRESWQMIQAGDALRETLEQLRNPQHLDGKTPSALHATLRPYQIDGLNWLWLCSRLGLGACLADDMGLGKTIQILAALLREKQGASRKKTAPHVPSLLVLPASLIGNWKAEAEKFAPSLSLFVAHSSAHPTAVLQDIFSAKKGDSPLATADLVMTTYGMISRLPTIAEHEWNWIILDEAQAIKNPGTQQTRAIKKLRGKMRVALSGTPIENRLGDLWSLFDFINPGLLGSAKKFQQFIKQLQGETAPNYAPLRKLIAPYILRRKKSDPDIVPDLPDKTEMQSYCRLTKKQAALYQKAVDTLTDLLNQDSSTGIKRRGLVLSALMQFKQICNHPSQLLGDGTWDSAASGKFVRLQELCEEIASRGEKVLVFTQFREICDPLANFLAEVFGCSGLILHGGTKVADRRQLVSDFQRDDGPPFFILSLKAGGTGLNLTAASHVIHFDRWWNPAVENQATDRAFRIGQKRNVLVHKFVTQGTIEEKIDQLIRDKQGLADDLLEADGPTAALSEMSNEELLRMVTLDIDAVSER